MTNGIDAALLMLWPPALELIVQQRASRFFMEVGMPGAKCQLTSLHLQSQTKASPEEEHHSDKQETLWTSSQLTTGSRLSRGSYILFSRGMGLTAPTCVCS